MYAQNRMALPPISPLVKKLITVLFAAFIIELVLQIWLEWPVFQLLALDPTQLSTATFWQLLSYPLVETPGAVFKVLLNLLMLWWFLSPFEANYGPRRTMQFIVAATLSASLPALAIGLLFSGTGIFASSYLSGSDAIGLAALAAFAMSYRHGTINLFGIFPMKAMHLIFLSMGLSFLFFLASTT